MEEGLLREIGVEGRWEYVRQLGFRGESVGKTQGDGLSEPIRRVWVIPECPISRERITLPRLDLLNEHFHEMRTFLIHFFKPISKISEEIASTLNEIL